MNDIERQLLKAERPKPQVALRARVLATATPLVQPDDRCLDRIWFSRTWRTTAALIVATLAVAEMLSGTSALTAVNETRVPIETWKSLIPTGTSPAVADMVALAVASPVVISTPPAVALS